MNASKRTGVNKMSERKKEASSSKQKLRREAHLKALTTERDWPFLSVIIPAYNAEKYIRPCLSSILNQTVFENLEVIVIDDGSTDRTFDLIRQETQYDPRVKAVRQENKGPGEARNAGMRLARAPYLLFLDADDMLASGEALMAAFRRAEQLQPDAVLCGAGEIDGAGHSTGHLDWFLIREYLPEEEVFSGESMGNAIFLFCSSRPCVGLFRKAFIDEHALTFLPLKRSEDFYFTQLSLLMAQRITALPDTELVLNRKDYYSRTSLELTKDEDPLAFWAGERRFVEKVKSLGLWEKWAVAIKYRAVNRILYNLKNLSTWEGFRKVYDRLGEMAQFLELDREDFINAQKDSPEFRDTYRKYRELMDLPMEAYLHRLYARMNSYSQQLESKLAISRNQSGLQEREIRNSASFRVGRAITWLPRKVLGGVRCYQEHGAGYTWERLLIHMHIKAENSPEVNRK